jgi:hypothetical protein
MLGECQGAIEVRNWCRRTELNCRPTPYQGVALPLRYCGTSRGIPRGTAAITHGRCTRKGARKVATTPKLAYLFPPPRAGEVVSEANRRGGPYTVVKKDAARTEKLAAALKDNLKRRKAQARARGAPGEAEAPSGRGLGTAPQAGLEDQPQKGPNAAQKR